MAARPKMTLAARLACAQAERDRLRMVLSGISQAEHGVTRNLLKAVAYVAVNDDVVDGAPAYTCFDQYLSAGCRRLADNP